MDKVAQSENARPGKTEQTFIFWNFFCVRFETQQTNPDLLLMLKI